MLNYYRVFILAISVQFWSINLHAQETGQNSEADSLQRILLRDSLQISDSLITQVLALRHNYFIAAEQIRSNESLDASQQNNQAQALRTQTTNSLKALLSDELYERYTQMITRRMRSRNPANNNMPLAEGTGN